MKSLFAQFSVKKNEISISSFTHIALTRNDLFNVRGGGDDGRMENDDILLVEDDD